MRTTLKFICMLLLVCVCGSVTNVLADPQTSNHSGQLKLAFADGSVRFNKLRIDTRVHSRNLAGAHSHGLRTTYRARGSRG